MAAINCLGLSSVLTVNIIVYSYNGIMRSEAATVSAPLLESNRLLRAPLDYGRQSDARILHELNIGILDTDSEQTTSVMCCRI
jgi:hypothetical protein